MSARRYTYACCLSWGGDEPTAELEVEVSYTMEWGSSESGRFGPPENYDPGSPSFPEDIRVERIDGLPVAQWAAASTEYMPGSTVEAIIDKLECSDEHEAAMVLEATEAEQADYDDAMERRWEERRMEER